MPKAKALRTRRRTHPAKPSKPAARPSPPPMALLWGTLAALGVLLAGMMIFALVYKVSNLSLNVIQPVNQVLRIGALICGCWVCSRSCARPLGWAIGCGAAVMLLLHIIYWLTTRVCAPLTVWVSDLALGVVAGGAVGFLAQLRAKRAA